MESQNYIDSEIEFTKLDNEGDDKYKMEVKVYSETLDLFFHEHKLCKKRAEKFLKAQGSKYKKQGDTKEARDLYHKMEVAKVMCKLRNDKCKNLIFLILNKDVELWWA